MKIYLPHTKILDATLISLRGYDYNKILIKGKFGYSKYFKQRWLERESFINIEHDSVLWPGAIESLENCISPWCAFDYSSETNWERDRDAGIMHSYQLGGMKITQYLIDHTKGIWDKPIDWHNCDTHLFSSTEIRCHQHFPGIVNANPVLAIQQPK